MSIRSPRIKLEQFRYESYALLKQLKRSLQLLNSAAQLAAKESVISKTDPKIEHSNHDAMIGIRSISDRRSKINSLSPLFFFATGPRPWGNEDSPGTRSAQ
ncbi:hypothetical protein AVEN_143440-1 [Araneus ventricosus]|uniref:Uncharacterized protein n=1 Tax=Araneus ventricosus TaxID=182803 RepID=A0A4Y2RVF9_ARAVE|nr:hypothetical protein AVEN_143440-1 [Araneus ventricosus]